jgi:cysteine synthase A
MTSQRDAILFVEASTTGAGARANELANARGLYVVLLTRDSGQYGQEILFPANEIIVCETNDAAEVLDAAIHCGQRFRIVAITTTADMYVPQAAMAARRFKLPGLSYAAARRVRNKRRMRMALAKCVPEYSLPFVLARSRDQAISGANLIGYPLVIKPQEENDGVGVRLVHDRRQLENDLGTELEWSRNSADQIVPAGILLEAYCDAPEFSVETIQNPGGRRQIMGVTFKETIGGERNHFVEICHSFPYRGREATLAAAATERVLSALKIDHGAVHTECRVSGEDVRIMEINPRLAGGKIGSHLIEMATGCSAVSAVLDAALGKNTPWCPVHDGGAAIHFVFAQSPGIFRGIGNPAELLAMHGIAAVSPIAKPGARVGLPCSNRDRVAEILSTGPTASEAYANARAAFERVELSIDSI